VVRLRKVSRDNCLKPGCPALYVAEDGRRFAVGRLQTDPTLLDQASLGAGEGMIEVHPVVEEAIRELG
jgi:hypothetical protein